MLEERRNEVDPIVNAGPLGNNSLDDAQGLAQNLNLLSMEQILTTSLPTFDYILRMRSMSSLSSRRPSLTSSAISRPTWSAGYRTSCSPRPSCAHPSLMAPNTWRHLPRELSTIVSNGCSLAVRPPNGRWRWLKSTWPASLPRPTTSRVMNSSSKMPSAQRSWCSVVGQVASRAPWCRAAWRSWMNACSASRCPNYIKLTCSRRNRLPTCRLATISRKARSCTSSTASRRAPRRVLHVLHHRFVSHHGGRFSTGVHPLRQRAGTGRLARGHRPVF